MKAKSLLARLTAACLTLSVFFSGVASADSVTVATEKLNMRKEADASSKSITVVREGDELSFVSENDGWYQVKDGSRLGFVMKDYVVLDREKLEADIEENTALYSSAKSARTTARINMRELPMTSADIEKVLSSGAQIEVLGECGEWYLVQYGSRTGYLLAEYVSFGGSSSDDDETVVAPSQPDSSDSASSNTSSDENYAAALTGKVTTRVNMREKPSTSSDIEKVLAKNASVSVLGENGSWYKVSAGGRTGYISKAYVSITNGSASDNSSNSSSAKEEIYDSAVSGKASERVNLRKSASTSAKIVKVLSKGQTLSILGETGDWYKVSARGYEGYIAKAYVTVSGSSDSNNDDASDAVVPDGLVSYPAARTGAVTERVNMREEASTSCDVVKVLSKNTSVTVMGEMNGFYQVKAGSSFGFVSKNYVVLGSTGSDDAETEKNEDSSSDTSSDSSSLDTMFSSTRTGTTTVKVNMRREPEGDVLFTLPQGTYITLIGERGSWYKAVYNNSTGYLSKAYVTEGAVAPSVPEQDNTTVTPSQPEKAEGKTAYVSTGTVNMRKGPGTGYGVVKVLSKGDEITCYELTDGWYRIEQGSDEGYISSKYVTTTKPEVSAPSQPENGSGSTETVSGKVQMADWWTSNIQKVFARGVIATVTDVDTGISWQVLRSGGTNHADVQPLTAADTAKMKQAYGGKWSWNRRAIWVTIDGVSYAASMNGMPHGSGSITTNNFDGHHCIHFLNSRTHTGNRWDTAHQSMVQKAYKAGQ